MGDRYILQSERGSEVCWFFFPLLFWMGIVRVLIGLTIPWISRAISFRAQQNGFLLAIV